MMDFCRLGRSLNGNKRKRKDKEIIGPSQRIENVVEHEGQDNTMSLWTIAFLSFARVLIRVLTA